MREIEIKVLPKDNEKQIRDILRDFGVSSSLLTKLKQTESGITKNGEFTKAITDRPKSQAYKTVFPIHEKTLSVNKNLSQNPGYGK